MQLASKIPDARGGAHRTAPDLGNVNLDSAGGSRSSSSVGRRRHRMLHRPARPFRRGGGWGDVVYNGVHMMTAETDDAGRAVCIASLDAIAALVPEIVVAGHKHVGAPDIPESIGASQQYLRDFSRIVEKRESRRHHRRDARTARRSRQSPHPVALCPNGRRQTGGTGPIGPAEFRPPRVRLLGLLRCGRDSRACQRRGGARADGASSALKLDVA